MPRRNCRRGCPVAVTVGRSPRERHRNGAAIVRTESRRTVAADCRHGGEPLPVPVRTRDRSRTRHRPNPSPRCRRRQIGRGTVAPVTVGRSPRRTGTAQGAAANRGGREPVRTARTARRAVVARLARTCRRDCCRGCPVAVTVGGAVEAGRGKRDAANLSADYPNPSARLPRRQTIRTESRRTRDRRPVALLPSAAW